jgi:hypothetical protein
MCVGYPGPILGLWLTRATHAGLHATCRRVWVSDAECPSDLSGWRRRGRGVNVPKVLLAKSLPTTHGDGGSHPGATATLLDHNIGFGVVCAQQPEEVLCPLTCVTAFRPPRNALQVSLQGGLEVAGFACPHGF